MIFFVKTVFSELTKQGDSESLRQITPVSKAVARHMGVDLSRNHRGIAIMVYGAPLIGKKEKQERIKMTVSLIII